MKEIVGILAGVKERARQLRNLAAKALLLLFVQLLLLSFNRLGIFLTVIIINSCFSKLF